MGQVRCGGKLQKWGSYPWASAEPRGVWGPVWSLWGAGNLKVRWVQPMKGTCRTEPRKVGLHLSRTSFKGVSCTYCSGPFFRSQSWYYQQVGISKTMVLHPGPHCMACISHRFVCLMCVLVTLPSNFRHLVCYSHCFCCYNNDLSM